MKTAATLPPLLYKEDKVVQHLEDWVVYCDILSQRADKVISKMKYEEQVEKVVNCVCAREFREVCTSGEVLKVESVNEKTNQGEEKSSDATFCMVESAHWP